MLQVGAWPSRLASDAARVSRPISSLGSIRVSRMLALSSCGLLALLLAVQVIVATHPGGMLSGQLGFDYDMYMNATRRFLAGGGFYAPGQLAGPYAVTDGNILYPPELPRPARALHPPAGRAVVGGPARDHRLGNRDRPTIPVGLGGDPCAPGIASSIRLALFSCARARCDRQSGDVDRGGGGGRDALGLAGGVRPAETIGGAIRPDRSDFDPEAGGLRLADRRLSLATLPLWLEYVTAVMNARGPRATLLYSVTDVPLMLIPIIAWLGRRK